jgi:hypothetical protein
LIDCLCLSFIHPIGGVEDDSDGDVDVYKINNKGKAKKSLNVKNKSLFCQFGATRWSYGS